MSPLWERSSRRWLITGASGGLGRALATYALDQGDHVTATVRRPAALGDLLARHGERLAVETLDLTQAAAIPDVVKRTLDAGPVDIVVNNAGYALVGAAEEMTDEQVRNQIDVLLLSPMMITRAFLAPMRTYGGGRIIQISSMGGQVAVPSHSAYHAGKWGLEGFTESVSREVSDFNIHLTIVEPGATRTGFGSALQYTTESPAYRDGAVGRIRRALEGTDPASFPADPARIAAAIYATTRNPEPPVRLTFGVDAYDAIDAALTERLAALHAQRAQAASVDFA
jgi:NAD(P)-dependent dehydrogenase (short-subunit alcohol dehydrogenase family)